MPSIQGPAAASKTGAPPTFQVDSNPNQFYAYELATEAPLFDTAHQDAAHREGEQTSENFYASWNGAQLAASSTFRVPDAAWVRLRHANRLYYRALTSQSSTRWINTLATTPDAEAQSAPFVQLVQLMLGGVLNESHVPVVKIWNVAQQLKAIRAITSSRECQALIGWHAFSPEWATDPQAAEWVVLVTSQSPRAEERVNAGLVRLAAQTLSVKETKNFHDTSHISLCGREKS